MFRKTLTCAAALAALAAATPAAASVTISFTGGNSATDGTDGNIRTTSNGGITVQTSGWSYDGNTLERAWLGSYGQGLGVTNNDEGNGTSSNNHTVDNLGQQDFVLLIFNQAVNIQSAVLTPFDISPTANDNDAWVSYANLGGLFTSPTPTAVPLNSALWSLLMGNDYTVSGNMGSGYSTSFNSTGFFGNAWLIGAANPNPDRNDDGFKLSSIVVNPTPAVPEPATWAMMLIGFGAVGFSMRRGRRIGILQQA
ncbi:PEPxxWA-CTERM sorting domain-containing protein [Sphingomonas daechungensis]|uniref:PEPxxWA-CTERM sorting domain-containing protein n=1 Tax=Sphingomonas daechungensis TaxID=1176646 RepID=UPI003783BBB5